MGWLIPLVIDCSQHSLRRLRRNAGPEQSVPEQDWKASSLSSCLYGSVGSHIWSHRWLPDLRRACRLSVYARIYRGCILCKPSILILTALFAESTSLRIDLPSPAVFTISLAGILAKSSGSEL